MERWTYYSLVAKGQCPTQGPSRWGELKRAPLSGFPGSSFPSCRCGPRRAGLGCFPVSRTRKVFGAHPPSHLPGVGQGMPAARLCSQQERDEEHGVGMTPPLLACCEEASRISSPRCGYCGGRAQRSGARALGSGRSRPRSTQLAHCLPDSLPRLPTSETGALKPALRPEWAAVGFFA